MALFDGIQSAAYSTAKRLFGDTAVWQPSNGGESQTELVLFRNSNEPIEVGDSDRYRYMPYDYSIEFFEDKFIGLKSLVESGTVERIQVRGFDLAIREVKGKFDGKTLIAYGEIYAEITED